MALKDTTDTCRHHRGPHHHHHRIASHWGEKREKYLFRIGDRIGIASGLVSAAQLPVPSSQFPVRCFPPTGADTFD